MEQSEISNDKNDGEYSVLNSAEISALLKASSVSTFMPSEKVKQAPLHFQKKTLAELAQISTDNELSSEPLEQSENMISPEAELNTVNKVVDEPDENVPEFDEVGKDDPHTYTEVNPTSVKVETSEYEDLCLKLKKQVSDLEAHILKLEAELTDLSSSKNVAEEDATVIKQLLNQLPPLSLKEEEKFSQKVLSTIEDVIRTRLGIEISEHPETFVFKLKEKIKDLFVEGSRVLIELNSEDLEVIQHVLKDIELGQHITLLASNKLGRGDLVIKAGSIEINDSLQIGSVEADPEKYHD